MTRSIVLLAVLVAGSCADDTAPADESPIPPFTVRGRWSDASAIHYRVDDTHTPLEPGALRAAVERAIAVWRIEGSVGFIADDDAHDLVFAWGRTATDEHPERPFGRDTSVALTGPVGPGCRVLFGADRDWGGTGPTLARAAVHELGHALGLDHVEAESSVMHPQWERGRAEPGACDLAGLHSLYGGGAESSGDLVGWPARAGFALHAVAPPDRAGWTVFDTDGDGRDEVLVWGTDEASLGALTIYRFGDGARLERTVGPQLGIAGHGARVDAFADDAGTRWLDVRWPDGSSQRRPFGPGSLLGASLEAGPAGTRPVQFVSGDLDGDGRHESLRRVTDRP